MSHSPPLCHAELEYQEPAPEPQLESTTNPATIPADPAAPEDPELEKRKARAARFGIPLVEPKLPQPTDKKSKKQQQSSDVRTHPIRPPAVTHAIYRAKGS